MYIADISIKRPLLVTVLVAAVVLFGIISLSRLPIELLPNIEVPVVAVVTAYPGVGPSEVEGLVTNPIEDAVSPIGGIKELNSYSRESVSIVVVQFEEGSDLNAAATDVRDKVSAAAANLPEGAEDPTLMRFDPNAQPIMKVAFFSGGSSGIETRRLADEVVKERMQRLPGVASVEIQGGVEREIEVRVDQGRLQAYNISIGQVVGALKGDNLNLPGGRVDRRTREYVIRTTGEFSSVAEIASITVADVEGVPILVGDVAEVVDGNVEVRRETRLMKRDSVTMVVQKQSGANTVALADAVRKVVEDVKKELPAGSELRIVEDNSVFIRDAVNDLRDNLIMGILLATLVIFLFLRDLRSTFIIFTSIPTSIIAAFTLIYFGGFTINMMSLMGMALSVGMLCDDSIVVLENIFRHFESGKKPREASAYGTGEIGGAVIATTATILAVFLPIAFMSGIAGQFFRQFGLTVAFCIAFSTFVALTLIPSMASRMLRHQAKKENAWDRFYGSLEKRYEGILAWCLSHRWPALGMALAALVLALTLVPMIGTEAFPFVDQKEMSILVEMPTGTSLELTDATVRGMEKYLSERPDVESFFSDVGSSGVSTASILVKLKPGTKEDTRRVGDRIRSDIATPGATITVTQPGMGPGGGGTAADSAPVRVNLRGPDPDRLKELALRVQTELAAVPGLTGIDNTMDEGRPEVRVRVDRRRAEDRQVSPGQVAMAVRTAMTGDVATKYRQAGQEYDIRVRLRQADRGTLDSIGDLTILNSDRKMVRLSEVAEFDQGGGPAEIEHLDRQRLAGVYANLESGYNVGKVMKQVRSEMNKIDLPSGYSLNYGGQAEMMKMIFGPMFQALFLSIVLIYLALVALYESWLYPFVIMFSVPLAAVGAFPLLLMAGKSVNIMSLIGLIMLGGIVTKNAILLVDYANIMREQGMSRDEALLHAGPTRMRPILMTALTTILALLPLSMGIGQGAGMRSPMAVAVIGGMITSTALTLLIVPVVYSLMDRRQDRPDKAGETSLDEQEKMIREGV